MTVIRVKELIIKYLHLLTYIFVATLKMKLGGCLYYVAESVRFS